ncbi:MAG: hypothetical protein E7513_00365 [Ruminococcaceae bacterium]|nr:hypothetical protein [Oscillospiraceae bacterium]
MNQSNKTSSFLKAINKYAKQQSDAILQEVEEFKKQEIEKATKEGIKDAYTLIQKEISVKKALIVSDVAMREQNSKRELFVKRNEIVENVFKKAYDKLYDFTKTADYIELIRKSAHKISKLFDNNECVIYLKSADADKADSIKEIINNCKIEFDDTIHLGGIKGYCEALSIIADDTLDSKLNDQRQWFCENSGLKVV